MLKSIDPRYFQISILTGLYLYLSQFLDSTASVTQFVIFVGSGICFQWLFCRYYKVKFTPLSILISCISLTILLRVNNFYIPVVASFLAVSSKFLLRTEGGHIFNPSNIAIAILLLVLPEYCWISPSQWGREIIFAFVLSSAGLLMTSRVTALSTAVMFLVFYMMGKFSYALYMGDPLTIPMLVLSNGGLYIFTFYMVTDPFTAPRHFLGKSVYAFVVAGVANYFELYRYWPSGIYHALALACLFVPVLNKIFVQKVFVWNNKAFNH